MSDPYRVLGVRPDASQAEIRAAYLQLAKQHHPDGGRGDAQRMAAINAAWATLRERRPARSVADVDRDHASADDERSGGIAPSPSLPPARIPWRFMAGMAAAGIIVVLIGAATADGTPRQQPPDRILQPGSCIDLDERQEAVEVACDGPHQFVVQQLVDVDGSCLPPSQRFRDTQGLGWVCAVPAD